VEATAELAQSLERNRATFFSYLLGFLSPATPTIEWL
jgi:hypothetical protein